MEEAEEGGTEKVEVELMTVRTTLGKELKRKSTHENGEERKSKGLRQSGD